MARSAGTVDKLQSLDRLLPVLLFAIFSSWTSTWCSALQLVQQQTEELPVPGARPGVVHDVKGKYERGHYYYDDTNSVVPAVVLSGAASSNLTMDAEALLAFKRGISQDHKAVLNDWDTKSIASACTNWTGVTCDLRSNRVTGLNLTSYQLEGSISPRLGGLQSLQALHLAENNFTGDLPPELGNLSSLAVLDVSRNMLQGTIPTSLGSLQNLEFLNLGYNLLTGMIPPELGMLKNLNYLLLQFNQLEGSIPPSIFNATELVSVGLDTNLLTGSIPWQVGNLGKLEEFFVWGNQLTGHIPASIGNCTSAIDVEFNHNQLSGTIPGEVGKLGKLVYFYVWGNLLTGHIPASIGNCTFLIDLELSHNQLSGPIPSSLANIAGLQMLYLGWNNLTGPIPDELQNLTKIGYFLLESNFLSGPIPSWIGQRLLSVSFLELFENSFTGSIPSNIGQLPALVDFSAAHNQLSGPIPPELGNLQTLQDGGLDLSYNHLSGSIPTQLSGLQTASLIILAHNNLSGSIPNSLGDCKSLKILDLSMNNLVGVIPESLALIPGLQLNLSYNSLVGRVPLSVLSNFTAASFDGNPGLCGQLLGKECAAVSPVASGFAPNDRTGKHSERSWVSTLVICIAVVGFVAFEIIMVLLVWCWWPRLRECLRTWQRRHQAGVNLELDCKEASIGIRFSNGALQRATDGFSTGNLVGTGARSTVFMGVMSLVVTRGSTKVTTKVTIAVKRLNRLEFRKKDHVHEDVRRQLVNEMQTLGKVRHRNLLRILGSCFDLEMQALVLQFMPNGSLDAQLHETQVCKLDWRKRVNIAIGMAHGMVYLHHECHEPIIHCDLKPRNILLDADFEPKVADFGISKFVNPDTNGEDATVSKLRGTTGYIPPEYAFSTRVSTKGDVYSYGIVLLELLTGRKPTSDTFDSSSAPTAGARSCAGEPRTSSTGSAGDLVGWARQNLATPPESILCMIDQRLLTDFQSNKFSSSIRSATEDSQSAHPPPPATPTSDQSGSFELSGVSSAISSVNPVVFKALVRLALHCASEKPQDRPSMREALELLVAIAAQDASPPIAAAKSRVHPDIEQLLSLPDFDAQTGEQV